MAGSNKIVRSVSVKSAFPSAQALIGASTSWNQGDLLVLDTSTNKLKVQSAETDSANFQGIAVQTIKDGKIASPYNTDVVASQAIADVAGPVVGVVAKLVAKTGDAFNPGDLVGLAPATGTRGVSSTITTTSVGVYQGPVIASAAAGQEIEVLLGVAKIDSAAII